jgi:hypothetical protein
MKSPFPGMDPYLEAHWRDVHTRLITYVSDQLQEQLPDGLLSRVEENVLIDFEDEGQLWSRPDVQVTENSSAKKNAASVTGPSNVATPVVILADSPETERHITIIDPASGGRVVTAIEILSPTNKLPGEGRSTYRRRQRDYLAAGINLVEIDLIRTGDYVLSAPWMSIPPEKHAPYMACIFRAAKPELRMLYPMPLRERLPIIPIPLREGDRDIVLDLQQLIDQCYQRGRYNVINYEKDPTPSLAPADARWMDELLRQKGSRK